VGRKREAGDNAERPASTALQCPEQVRFLRLIDDAGLAVGGDDLGFRQARGGGRRYGRTRLPHIPGDGGALEHAKEMAAHESPRTTKLCDRT
jgi:hypothetical protein